ncbi:MAG TPA: hypothetical protein VK968_10180, partial [Roseimicrobium sp.]|nr:hypothetical protein [Roseimicrobium sp.]
MRKTLIIGIIGLLFCGSSSAFALPLRNSLAMFESGATAPFAGASDRMRGASGEVSRYQIMPDVWRRYSSSRDYANPEVAWSVAKVILNERIAQFKEATGRQPSAEE